jgi:hypothetical protein
MATEVSIRKGLGSLIAVSKGVLGELFFNQSTGAIHTQDGVTLGGAQLVATVPNLARLRAFSGMAQGDMVRLAGRDVTADGGEGLFYFDASDHSSSGTGLVPNDEVTSGEGDGGVYVAPSYDKTGASGAFVRKYDLIRNLRWYTGDPTGKDVTLAMEAVTRTPGEVIAPIGRYRFRTVSVSKSVHFVGTNNQVGFVQIANRWAANPTYAGTVTIFENYGDPDTDFFDSDVALSMTGIVVRTIGQPDPFGAQYLFKDQPPPFCRFDNCLFEGISGLGKENALPWGGWRVTRCHIHATQGDAIEGAVVDCFIYGNTFTSVNGTCINVKTGGGLNTIFGNRFEFTTSRHINLFQSRLNTIDCNHFDRGYEAGVTANDCDLVLGDGNIFYRNAFFDTGDNTAHIKLQACGTVYIGGHFQRGVSDAGEGPDTPRHIIRFINQQNPVYLSGNLENGFSDRPFIDGTGNTKRVVVLDAFRVSPTDADTVDDRLAIMLANLGDYCAPGVKAIINEDRKLNSFVNAFGVVLHSIGASPSVIDASAGNVFCDKHNVTFDTITYTISQGRQYATAKPNGSAQQGRFPVGAHIYDITPAAGDPMGWVVTANGSPDTLVNMPSFPSP